MVNVNQLCMQCMRETGGAELCPHCGYREDALQTAPYLPVRTWLLDRYLVGKLVTADGEGALYMGWDNILQSPVQIREYLPEGLCARAAATGGVTPLPGQEEEFRRCLAAFLEGNRALGRLRDMPALFPVYDIVECNGTAYAVSEYTESITLESFLHRNGERLTFEQTRALMMPAVSTLSSLHAAGIWHGGISPETLYVGKDGRLRFTGFAGAEVRSARGALPARLAPGYAALEQYGLDGKLGPQTDVYAFAACVLRAVTGQTPPDARSRMNGEADLPEEALAALPPHAAAALREALQLLPDARTADAEHFRAAFSAAPSIAEGAPLLAEDEPEEESEKPAKGRGALVTAIAMAATLLVLAAVFFGVDYKWHVFGVIGGGDQSDGASLLVISSNTASAGTGSQLTRKIENFVGQSLAACERNYGSYNFKVDYKKYSEEVESGVIISQSPAAGTEIPLDAEEAQTITVVVSLGSGQLRVPSVEGLTYAEALEKLWKAGFYYDSITCNTETPDYEGVVTRISPSAGSICGVYDAKIILYVQNPAPEPEPIPSEPEDNREVSSVPPDSSPSVAPPVSSTASAPVSSASPEPVSSAASSQP